MWIRSEMDTNIPEWLRNNIRTECSCGAPIENYYNDDGHCTSRRCSSSICPNKLAARSAAMLTLLGVEGIKDGKSRQIIVANGLKSHFEVIPYVFTNGKPKISLAMYMKVCFIPGYSDTWSKVCQDYSSPEEFVKNYDGQYSNVVAEYKDIILDNAKYFQFKEKTVYEYDAVITGTVMLTGSIDGFANRNTLIIGLNKLCKGYVRLSISESVRKTGIMALIRQDGPSVTPKLTIARETGVPVMTPEEFRQFIVDTLIEKGVDVNDLFNVHKRVLPN